MAVIDCTKRYEQQERELTKLVQARPDYKSTHSKDKYKTGEIITFKNGFGVEVKSKILGFDNNDELYLLWDCYWYTIKDTEKRQIKRVA